MANVIDALVITLGLDPSGYKKGQREATDSLRRTKEEARGTAKDIEESGKRASDFYGRLKREALGFFAAYAGFRAFQTSLGRDASASDASVGRLSRTLGIATDRLSAFQGMAERVGGTKEGLNGSFQSLQSQIENFRLLGTPISGAFRSLGIKLANDENGQQRPIEDIYRDIVGALRRRTPGERPTLARELGVGEEAVGFAGLPEGEFNRLFEEQKKLGTVTAQQAAAGQRLLEAWQNLSQAFDTMWRRIREALEPGITALLAGIQRFVTWLTTESKPLLDQVNATLRWLGDYLGSAEFRNDLTAFGRGLHDLGVSIVKLLRLLGIVPDPNAEVREEPGQETRGAGANPDNRSLGARRYDTLSQLPTWAGGYGEGDTPDRLTGRHLRAFQLFREAGYSPEAAAGAVARLQHESALNPNAPVGDEGRSHGIMQMNGSRLEAFQRRHGGRLPETTDLDTQIRHAIWEMSEEGPEAAAGRALRAARTAREAGQIASRRWIRPGRTEDKRAWEERRTGDTANNFFGALVNPPSNPRSDAEAEARRRSGRERGQEDVLPNNRYRRQESGSGSSERGEEPLPNPSLGRQSYLDPGLLTGARAAFAMNQSRVSTSTDNSSQVTATGPITITTQSSDPQGIARDFKDRLASFSMVDQATRGLA